MSVHRRQLPMAITVLVGVLTVFTFFFRIKETDSAMSIVTNWGVIISAFAVCFGAASAFITGMSRIRRREKGTWYLSLWLLIVMFTYIVAGVGLTPSHPSYTALYNAVIPMVTTAMWGLVGASTVSAAFRCFRLKSIEASLVMIPAIILILMTTPVWDAYWPGFAIAGKWITDVPSLAGNRGFIIAAAIGAIAISFRTLIGKEVGYLGRE